MSKLFKVKRDDKLISACVSNSLMSFVCRVLIRSIYSQFYEVRNAAATVNYSLSYCIAHFRLCLHRSRQQANMSKSSKSNITFLPNLADHFFTIALPMLLTNALSGLAVEDSLMLKSKFTVPGMMMSSWLKIKKLNQ